ARLFTLRSPPEPGGNRHDQGRPGSQASPAPRRRPSSLSRGTEGGYGRQDGSEVPARPTAAQRIVHPQDLADPGGSVPGGLARDPRPARARPRLTGQDPLRGSPAPLPRPVPG